MNMTHDPSRYVFPSLDLLKAPEEPAGLFNDLQDAAFIQAKLLGLDVSASVKKINRGPQATQYALLLESGANINVLVNKKKALAERMGGTIGSSGNPPVRHLLDRSGRLQEKGGSRFPSGAALQDRS